MRSPLFARARTYYPTLLRPQHALKRSPIFDPRPQHQLPNLCPCVRFLGTTPTISTAMASNAPTPRFASGSDVESLSYFISPLLKANGGRWALGMDGQALEREFKFKTFAKTWDFMTAVSLQCKLKNHHPEWSNVFNTTFIRWTTHSPPGLTAKDIDLVIICDKLAADFGEVVPASATSTSSASSPSGGEQGQGQGQSAQQQQGGGETCGLAGLANRAVGAAGDCCVPKGVKKEEGVKEEGVKEERVKEES